MAKTNNLRAAILALLRSPKYQPLDKVELSKKLGLTSDERAGLRAVLRTLESEGVIARIRKDRYVLPNEANLSTGILRVRPSGSGWMESEGGAELVITAENTGTAMNGDRVVARIVHEGVEQKVHERDRGKPQARVIRILERANETIVGTLQASKKFHYVIPDDPRLVHNIYVHPGAMRLREETRVGDKVVVKVDEWKSRHVNPEGEIIEVLGPASAPGVDMLSIIRKHHLPTEFPAAVLREADMISERVEERDLVGREDVRGRMVLTIDPDDARDFDDAIHVERTFSKNGESTGWQLGVHIADVSHYVRSGSALDREALKRGNSVYLADRVIPMLPERLSNGVCSLKPLVDRLTWSAFIEFSENGKIKRARFSRTVIRSAARLTYKQAFAILTGQKTASVPMSVPDRTETIAPNVAEHLHVAWELASLLRKNRFAAGSLDLDFPEVKVWLNERGQPVRLEKMENDISHQLVEEFMLAANEVVAREIKNRLLPAIYRIHEDPEPQRLADYRELAISYGFKAGDLTNRREVQRFLASIRGRAEEYALKIGFLKSLKRAVYGTKPIGHYGLAKTNYTHFTSPIRRYADLVVHRVLGQMTARGEAKKTNPAPADLSRVSEHISDTERTAADAEKESVKLKKLEYFQNQLRSRKPDAFQAVIVDVRSYGLVIELTDVLLTGLIHVSALQDDFYVFDPTQLQFSGRRKRKVFRIGDRLAVIVSRVDVYKQQVDFHPVERQS